MTGTAQGCEHLDQPYRRLLAEVERYRAVEARLRARCGDVERGSVDGGVLSGDLSTHELRSAGLRSRSRWTRRRRSDVPASSPSGLPQERVKR